jgi:NitT/TauT family transport system permease protein
MAERIEDNPERSGTVAALRTASLSGSRAMSIATLVSQALLPIIVVIIFLILWQILPPMAGLQSYEFPTATDTLTGLQNDWPDIGSALLMTFQDAMAGFIVGNLLAIIGATIFAYSRTMERAFYPLAIVFQTIPVLVYAPLLAIIFFKMPILSANWSGYAVVGVAVLITFFPTLVNMNVGLKAVDPRVLELMRLLNASRTQIFLKLRLPSSMPFLFSSLKITSTLAFVGALVGEYMVGAAINPIGQGLSRAGVHSILGFETNPFSLQGIGGEMQILYSRVDKPGIFAAVVTVSVMTLLFFGLMVVLERVLVPWRSQP